MTSQQQAADPSRPRAAAGARRGGTLGAVAALAVIAVTSFAGRGVAAALPQSFSVSPSSGPPGTVVKVSGTGCSPGINGPSPQDYVRVSSTIFGLPTDVLVDGGGSWQAFFTVSSNAIGAGLVGAACFTDGFPSLTTTYTPQGFIVTGNPPPTTTKTPTTPTTARQTTVTPPPDPGTSAPGATPTTSPTNGSTPGSTGGGTPDGGSPGSGGPGGGGSGGPGGSVALPGGGSGTTGSNGDPGGSTSGAIGSPAGSKAGPTSGATAAGLRDPRLASSTSSHGDSGSLWILWLVLIALAAGALALLWWWQHREPGEADPAPEMT